MPQRTHAKGPQPCPNTRTPAPTASRQRTLTAASPSNVRPGEDERLTLDAPGNGTRHSPQGHPPASFIACNGSSQERTRCGWCIVPTAAPPAPREHGQRDLATRSKDGQPGEGERPTPDAPHIGERHRPRATFQHPRGVGHPAGQARQGASAGFPHLRTRPHSKRAADPDCLPQGRAAGTG